MHTRSLLGARPHASRRRPKVRRGRDGRVRVKGQGLLCAPHPDADKAQVKACAAAGLRGSADPGTAKGSAEVLVRFDQAHTVFLKTA